MPKWRIRGFRGASATELDCLVSGGETQVRALLERLAARHLTDTEIMDATFGNRTDLDLHKDSRQGHYSLMTTGTDYHYVASIENE